MKRGKKQDEQLNNKPNVMFCLALVLLLFVGYTTCYVSGLYARYASVGVGRDAAKVASFSVSAVEDQDARDAEYDMGDSAFAQYKIDLENNSEVTVSYSIMLIFEDALPEGVKPLIGENEGSVSLDQKVFTFKEEGRLGIGGSASEVLKFVPDGTSYLENYSEETDMSWTSLEAFKVQVEFVQVD